MGIHKRTLLEGLHDADDFTLSTSYFLTVTAWIPSPIRLLLLSLIAIEIEPAMIIISSSQPFRQFSVLSTCFVQGEETAPRVVDEEGGRRMGLSRHLGLSRRKMLMSAWHTEIAIMPGHEMESTGMSCQGEIAGMAV